MGRSQLAQPQILLYSVSTITRAGSAVGWLHIRPEPPCIQGVYFRGSQFRYNTRCRHKWNQPVFLKSNLYDGHRFWWKFYVWWLQIIYLKKTSLAWCVPTLSFDRQAVLMGALETTHVNIFIRNLKSMIRGKFTKLQHLTVTIANMTKMMKIIWRRTKM